MDVPFLNLECVLFFYQFAALLQYILNHILILVQSVVMSQLCQRIFYFSVVSRPVDLQPPTTGPRLI